MKFTITILAGLVGLAVAQSTTDSGSASATVTQTPVQTCLAACAAGDVNCQAACEGIPYPDAAQINATTECSMQCSQGDGGPAATEAYGQCLANCRASHFLSTGTNFVGASTSAAGGAAATGTGSSAGTTTGSSGAAQTGSSASGSSSGASGSATGSAASSSSSAGAATVLQVGAPVAGWAALFMAVFAL